MPYGRYLSYDMGLLFNKETKLVRTFQPPPTPPPQRILSGGEVHEQRECLFLRLPSEIRNEIYYLVFGTPTEIEYEEKSMEDEDDGGDRCLQSLRISTSYDLGNRTRSLDTYLRPLRTLGLRGEQDRMPETRDADVDPRLSFASNNLELDPQEPGPDVEPSMPAHGLSLLLTCRKVSQEATILAFNIYTFNLTSSKPASFFILRHSTAHLSPKQFSAITTLALDLSPDFRSSYRKASDFLSNAILLFPTVQRLTIRVPKGKRANQQAHMLDMFSTLDAEGPVRDAALRRYVPNWLSSTIQHVVNSPSSSWQTGHKWRVEWPQFDSPLYVQGMEYANPIEGWQMTGSMPQEAAGVVEGVKLCICGCGELRWLAAHLVQETGRRVKIGVEYCRDAEAEELRKMKIRLEPLKGGADPLPLTWLQGGDAAGWEVDEQYWNELRAKKGNFTAMWKLRTWRFWGSLESE
jgi:hypothetical protein